MARVGATVITAETFRHEIVRRGLTDGPGAQRQKDALLDELIRVEVLAAAAREAGFDKDPEFVSNIKRLLAERYLREKLTPPAETLAVKDAEVAQYYDEHKADFGAVERRRAALIFLRVPASASEEAKQAARARAEAALAEAGKQAGAASFGPLAARHSEDTPTRYIGGDIGYLQKGGAYRWDPAVTEAVFALSQPGELAPLVEGKDGLYVVRLMEIDPGQPRPLATVQATIARLIAQEKAARAQRDAYEKLKAALAIKVDRAVLDAIPLPPRSEEGSDQPPPPLPQQP